MKAIDVEYDVAGVRYIGAYFADDRLEGRRPGVLVAPEGGGLVELTRSIARRLAETGYAALAMDYYGGGKPLGDMDDVMTRLGRWRADPADIRAIGRAALGRLASQSEVDSGRLAAIGYCFGGTTALELARDGAPLKCVVGFHSGLATARPASRVDAKILVCIGAADPLVPASQRSDFEAEVNASGADWRMLLMGRIGHSFTNPNIGAFGREGFTYDAVADRRSWAAMMDLFGETLS